MVVVEPDRATYLDWSSLRREAVERNTMISAGPGIQVDAVTDHSVGAQARSRPCLAISAGGYFCLIAFSTLCRMERSSA